MINFLSLLYIVLPLLALIACITVESKPVKTNELSDATKEQHKKINEIKKANLKAYLNKGVK